MGNGCDTSYTGPVNDLLRLRNRQVTQLRLWYWCDEKGWAHDWVQTVVFNRRVKVYCRECGKIDWSKGRNTAVRLDIGQRTNPAAVRGQMPCSGPGCPGCAVHHYHGVQGHTGHHTAIDEAAQFAAEHYEDWKLQQIYALLPRQQGKHLLTDITVS